MLLRQFVGSGHTVAIDPKTHEASTDVVEDASPVRGTGSAFAKGGDNPHAAVAVSSESTRRAIALEAITPPGRPGAPGGSKSAPQLPPNSHDVRLEFESRYETGNLRAAVRVGPSQYALLLDPDTNTGGHTQWFNFQCDVVTEGADKSAGKESDGASDLRTLRAMHQPIEVTLAALNLEKADSSYNHGMRPVVYVEGTTGESTPLPERCWRSHGAQLAQGCVSALQSALQGGEVPPAVGAADPDAHDPPSTSILWRDPPAGDGWRRLGIDVAYFRSHMRKQKRQVG